MEKTKLKNLDINDKFFDILKKDYKDFTKWFKEKKNRDAYYITEDNKIKALLILKIETPEEDYSNINPPLSKKTRLKISTFKVDKEHNNIGKDFITIIDNNARENKVDEIYYTIYNNSSKKKKLINMLSKQGYKYHGLKNNEEEVYIKEVL